MTGIPLADVPTTSSASLSRTPFSRVCVFTDLDGRFAALPIGRCRSLPLAEGAIITLAHVTAQLRGSGSDAVAPRALERRARTLQGAFVRAKRPDVLVQCVHRAGALRETIAAVAAESHADLIVLGPHENVENEGLFGQTTTETLTRSSTAAVLVVRKNARTNQGYRHVVFAVDVDDPCRTAVERGLGLLASNVERATMLHAFQIPFEGFIKASTTATDASELRAAWAQRCADALTALQLALPGAALRWHNVVVRGDAATAILAAATRERSDLIVVGSHGRSRLATALLGSVASAVLRDAPCDVLIARAGSAVAGTPKPTPTPTRTRTRTHTRTPPRRAENG